MSIHSSSVVAAGAVIPASCTVGPFCTIGAEVVLGEDCTLVSHVVLDGLTTVGPRCEFFPFACIGLKTQDLKLLSESYF